MPVKGHPGRIHGHFSKDFSHILFTTIIYYAAVQALLHPYIYYVAEITKFIGCEVINSYSHVLMLVFVYLMKYYKGLDYMVNVKFSDAYIKLI